jgi:hypothetical protein
VSIHGTFYIYHKLDDGLAEVAERTPANGGKLDGL